MGNGGAGATEWVDTRSVGPAESFVADTIVPPVILEPLALDCGCKPRDGHGDHEDDMHNNENAGGHGQAGPLMQRICTRALLVTAKVTRPGLPGSDRTHRLSPRMSIRAKLAGNTRNGKKSARNIDCREIS